MIKLDRNYKPSELTEHFVIEYTKKFKEDKRNVWNIPWLKAALLKISYGKCCYCECSLGEESKYMEVEHFEDKEHNPEKVLEWENLLPSCKRCNASKGTHNVIHEPIINPFKIDPRNELYFRLYRIKGKSPIGISTEEVLNLNDTERAVKKRFEVGEELEKQLETCKERLERYQQDQSQKRKNKLVNMVRELLKECQPDAIYSATCATILLSSHLYYEIKDYMAANEMWDNELEQLHKLSICLTLEIS
ncbi:MAG: HNH endonuclease [Bacteroidia bacterium]